MRDLRYSNPLLYIKIERAIKILTDVLRKYRTAISFNGGKDACVVLRLLEVVISRENLKISDVPVFYREETEMFEEVDQFVKQRAHELELTMIKLENKNFKDCLQEFIDKTEAIAIIMGVRVGDPRSKNLKVLVPTDEGWPSIIRVNPILDWSYRDVWDFILFLDISYCCLYNQGYTSLGNKTNTKPNEYLKKDSGGYSEAYLLQDPEKERAGRS
jgi:FAD synthetase